MVEWSNLNTDILGSNLGRFSAKRTLKFDTYPIVQSWLCRIKLKTWMDVKVNLILKKSKALQC